MSRPLDRTLALLGVVLVLATGGVALLSDKAGSSGQSAGTTPPAGSAKKTDRVEITDFKYKPPAIEVKVGSKVTFVNDDSAAHTATSRSTGAFDSGSIRQRESKSVLAEKAGHFEYYCAFHPFMKAKLRVVK